MQRHQVCRTQKQGINLMKKMETQLKSYKSEVLTSLSPWPSCPSPPAPKLKTLPDSKKERDKNQFQIQKAG